MGWDQNAEFNSRGFSLRPRDRVWLKSGCTAVFVEIMSAPSAGDAYRGRIVVVVPPRAARAELSSGCSVEFEGRNVFRRWT
jgi:hypothetical protein